MLWQHNTFLWWRSATQGIPASWYDPQGYSRYLAVDLATWHLLLLFGPGTPVYLLPSVITQDRFTINTIDGDNTEIAILMNMWDWWFLFHISYKIVTNHLANARSHRVNPHAPFNLWPPAFCPLLKLTTVISMPFLSFVTKTVEFGDFLWKKMMIGACETGWNNVFQEILNHSYLAMSLVEIW